MVNKIGLPNWNLDNSVHPLVLSWSRWCGSFLSWSEREVCFWRAQDLSLKVKRCIPSFAFVMNMSISLLQANQHIRESSTICQLGNLSWLNKPSYYVNIDMIWEMVMWEHIRNIWTLERTSIEKKRTSPTSFPLFKKSHQFIKQ